VDGSLIRIFVALAFAALLVWQSRKVQERPNQRRAYLLAAVALLAVVALNASLFIGEVGMLQLVVGAAAFLLLIAAAVFLLRAFRAGELRADAERANEMARAYRERRERELAASRSKGPDDPAAGSS